MPPTGLRALLVASLLLAACAGSPEDRYAAAQRSLDGGEARRAAIQLKSLLQQHPDHAAGRALLGRALLTTGEPAAAERELRLAMRLGVPAEQLLPLLARSLTAQRRYEDLLAEIDPSTLRDVSGRVLLLGLRGDALLQLQRRSEAVREYAAALELDGSAVPVLLGMADARAQLDGAGAAWPFIERAYAAGGERTQVDIAAASILMRAGEWARARALLMPLAARSDLAPMWRLQTLSRLTELALAVGDVGAARRAVAQLQELAGGTPEVSYLAARVHFVAAEYPEARALLQPLLVRDGGPPAARLLLGAVNLAQGNLGQADQELVAVIEAEPGNVLARRLLAETRMRQDEPQRALDALQAQDEPDGALLPLAAAASFAAGNPAAALALLERGESRAAGDFESLIAVALGYSAIGRTDQASSVLDRVRAAPGDLRGGLLLVAARLRAKDTESAVALAQILIRDHPQSVVAHAALGAALAAQGRFAQARAALEEAARLDPAALEPQLDLARLDLQQKSLDVAHRRLTRLREAQPDDLRVLSMLADVAIAQGDLPQAIEWLREASRRGPRAVEPRLLLARMLLAADRSADAVAVAREAAELAPEASPVLAVLAVALSANGATAEGVAVMQRLAQLRPRSAPVQYALARLLIASGDQAGALRSLARAERIDPTFAPAIGLRASLSIAGGRAREAAQSIERLRRARPDDVAADVLAADLAYREGRFAAAATAYADAARRSPSAALAVREHSARLRAGLGDALAPLRRWLAANPSDSGIRIVLASALQRQGDIEGAIANLEKVIADEPRNATALNNLAWLLGERGDARAADLAERAYAVSPGVPHVADTLGWVLLRAGDRHRAVTLLANAAKRLPRDAGVQYRYAVALSQVGRREESRELLRGLLATQPAFPERADAQQLFEELSRPVSVASPG